MDTTDCAVVVTGGASGLGEATARKLADQGARVTIFDRNRDRGQAIAGEIGGIFSLVDISDEESVQQGFAAAAEAHGALRILVNCAAIAYGHPTIRKGKPHPMADFDRVIKINLSGTFNCIRQAAVRMAALKPVASGERGVIVNTASIVAYEGQAGQAAYSASKGGIVAMTLPIARDLAGNGIRVVTVAPGLFSTPMMTGLPQEMQDAFAASVPFPPRLGFPSEFAGLVQHICENSYLNGEIIRLDGANRLAHN